MLSISLIQKSITISALFEETDGETALYKGPADAEADDIAPVNDQGGVVEASKKGESAKL